MAYDHQIPEVINPEGDICVPLFIPAHTDYVGLVLGVIRTLTLARHYEGGQDLTPDSITVRENFKNRTLVPLVNALIEGLDCSGAQFDSSGDCFSYPSSAAMINYSPQNPFSEPNTTPSGYLTPPFTRFANFPIVGWLSQWLPSFTEQLTGYLPDDIIVDISSIPSGSWSQPALGMPQISFDVTGNGTIELHLLNFPLGGRAIVTIDSQPNIGDILGGIIGNSEFIVELNRDLLSIPPENVAEVIYELEINDEVPTTHTVYITFAPTVDDSLIPINFGGGIRDIVLCGFDEVIMPIVEEIRLNNCVLEQRINGVWIGVGSVNDCVTAITDPMQAAITANTNNITTLQNDVNQIKTIDIPQINLSLTDHNNRIGTLEANIAQNNGILSDHEQRIVVLENASGGSSSGVPVTMRVSELIEAYIEGTSFDSREFIIPSGYDEIRVYMRTKQETNLVYLYAEINDNYTFANYRCNNGSAEINTPAFARFNLVAVETDGWFNVELVFPFASKNQRQNAIAYATYSADVNNQVPANIFTWGTDFVANGIQKIRISAQHTCDAGTEIQVYGIKNQDVFVVGSAPQNNIVDFEANSYPYTLPVGQSGIVASGGNPDQCLQAQNLADTDYIEVELDLGSQQTIEDVFIDVLSLATNENELILYIDDVPIGSPATLGVTFNTFTTSAFYPTAFPMVGQLVRIRARAISGNVADDIRIDNINVVVS